MQRISERSEAFKDERCGDEESEAVSGEKLRLLGARVRSHELERPVRIGRKQQGARRQNGHQLIRPGGHGDPFSGGFRAKSAGSPSL